MRSCCRAISPVSLGLVVWLALGSAGSACELVEGARSPLQTRKPVAGREARLTAGFGVRMHPLLGYSRLHTGVDWAAPLGTPVLAAGRGRVISAELDGAYGNRIIIDHGESWQTLYAQLATFSVQKDDCVEAGTIIGAVGATGLAIGPHLHFEVRKNGEPVDPLRIPVVAGQEGAPGGKR